MSVHTTTDVGRVRDVNEDSVCHESFAETQLLAVADGMGGHNAGDVASRTAIEKLRETVGKASGDIGRDSLETGIKRANDAVLSAATGDTRNMGTTLVTALVRGKKAVIGNVGDSRAYLVSADRIEQITVDQSLVQELIEQGTITEEEADTHPQRHVLAQALGTDDSVDPDFYQGSIGEGTLLLCSDGLTEEVDDGTIHGVVTSSESLEKAGAALTKRAKANGGSDNITVALYRA